MKYISYLGLLAVLAMVACAPKKQPMLCDVKMNSLDGGEIDVVRTDTDPRARTKIRPLQVFWQPPADGETMQLVVGYHHATLSGFGLTESGRLQFAPGIGAQAQDFQATANADGEPIANFSADSDFESEQGNFIFSTKDPAGRAMADAINKGKRIEVTIYKGGNVVAKEDFTTSGTGARDSLLVKAKQLIDSNDPTVCRPR